MNMSRNTAKRSADEEPEWKHVVILTSEHAEKGKTNLGRKVRCVYCDKIFSCSSVTRIREHLLGGSGHISKCLSANEDVVEEMRSKQNEYDAKAATKKRQTTLDTLTRPTSQVQPTIAQVLSKGDKTNVDNAVARAFYSCGIPFHVIRNSYFVEAVSEIAKFGPTYRLPKWETSVGDLIR
jgi:hypothetical protein